MWREQVIQEQLRVSGLLSIMFSPLVLISIIFTQVRKIISQKMKDRFDIVILPRYFNYFMQA